MNFHLRITTIFPPFFIAKKGGAKKSSPMIYFLKITRRFANKSQTHHFVSQLDFSSGWTKFFKQDFCFRFTCLFSTKLNQMDKIVSQRLNLIQLLNI
jgi:hypothetical protein